MDAIVAALIGAYVSSSTVTNWESKRGKLNLKESSMESLLEIWRVQPE